MHAGFESSSIKISDVLHLRIFINFILIHEFWSFTKKPVETIPYNIRINFHFENNIIPLDIRLLEHKTLHIDISTEGMINLSNIPVAF